MALSPAQLATLKAAILADATLNAFPNTQDGAFSIAELMNTTNPAVDFWVWRTSVSRAQIYKETSPDATTWNWTTYKNQAATEQNAWVQMFMGDAADFSQDNLRAGIAAIFTGSAQANAQRDHCLSVGRKKATKTEKTFATGTGSTVSPGKVTVTSVNYIDVFTARNLP